jgi:hypothetical protein
MLTTMYGVPKGLEEEGKVDEEWIVALLRDMKNTDFMRNPFCHHHHLNHHHHHHQAVHDGKTYFSNQPTLNTPGQCNMHGQEICKQF